MIAIEVLLGLGLMIAGAEFLVTGASRLARAVGLSPLVIGLTVVAYGTSAPEFAVGMRAGLGGQADIALGNVVGSNIFNVLFILGVSALIAPLTISSQLVRLDVPVMFGVSALTWLFAVDGAIVRWEGSCLALGIIFYTALLLRLGKKEGAASISPVRGRTEAAASGNSLITAALLVLVGLGFLFMGARWLVDGAVALAKVLGASELLIGLTLVAAGTSLPEAATSIVAAIRGERDIAVGNIVGSNIFNISAVLGASAAVSGRVRVSQAALHFDIPVMTAIAAICLPIFFTGGRISRWEGAIFLTYYVAYVAYLTMKSSQHAALPALSMAVFWFALPATLLGVGLSLIYALRSRR